MIVPVPTPVLSSFGDYTLQNSSADKGVFGCRWVTCLVFPDAEQLMECSSQQKESGNSCTSMETYRSEA